ncbi:MAG: J domain-containing protein [Methyloligellaceae bacterium]
MFERNVVDRGADSARKAHAVTLIFNDGQVVSGVCHVLATRTLEEELNNAGAFLDFEPYNGERSFMAKSSVVRIARIHLPKAEQLDQTVRFYDAADPYTILGVKRGAEPGAIQAAYHALAKQYHPDRFAGQDLPVEMAKYASEMSRRVNEAYTMLLQCEQQDAERKAREAAEAAAPKSAYDEFRVHAAARYG